MIYSLSTVDTNTNGNVIARDGVPKQSHELGTISTIPKTRLLHLRLAMTERGNLRR